MQNFTAFNPTNYIQLIAGVFFYATAAIVTFVGMANIYVLIRNGRSRPLSFIISVIYLLFFATLITQGIGLINSIK